MQTVSPETIARLAERFEFQVHDRAVLPPKAPEFEPVPRDLHPKVVAVLQRNFPGGLYSHQARAIAAAVGGHDVCVATSTASGKSLIFMSVAIHLVLGDPTWRVLALYPARALIQDQLEKWKRFAETFECKIGFIDGGVPRDKRQGILDECHVVLMTPDVAHAWLLPNAGNSGVLSFLKRVRLVVLDEAHVYDGVFGTNMCFMMRRLLALATNAGVFASTATIQDPGDFARKMIGREVMVFSPDEDGAGAPEKTVLLASSPGRRRLDNVSKFLHSLASALDGRFIAFADSRKTVEMVVSIMARSGASARDDDPEEAEPSDPLPDAPGVLFGGQIVLPYRAGYETEDREAIQAALAAGRLAGVVSTSALELGLDIGEINLVVLLNTPSSMKSFWQRMGRAGRRAAGVCLIIDTEGNILSHGEGALQTFLKKPLEPNWLYLHNRYIQYSNALCAAYEIKSVDERHVDTSVFDSLPDTFNDMLRNELDPTEAVPQDLYMLKQRAQDEPHREFPLRTCMEQSFQVVGPHEKYLGNLTYSQLLREAYPGAIYYYVASPYRIYQIQQKTGSVRAKREKRWTTEPLRQVKVFPRFDGGTFWVISSEEGFVTETEMQVSERVQGFVEKRGSAREEHRYGPGSPYSQRELNRFFETTGVCWYFPEECGANEAMALAIRSAFCTEYGVQERDLGVGSFFAKRAPFGEGPYTGACVFDSTSGSLRLTQLLGENFGVVLERAAEMCEYEEDHGCAKALRQMLAYVKGMRVAAFPETEPDPREMDDNWMVVVARDQKAMHLGSAGPEEVTVLGYRYTPQGVMYDLEPRTPGTRWTVRYETIQPIHGVTECVRYNLMTGEEWAL